MSLHTAHEHVQLRPWETAITIKCQAGQLSTTSLGDLAGSGTEIHKQGRMKEVGINEMSAWQHSEAEGLTPPTPPGKRKGAAQETQRLLQDTDSKRPWLPSPFTRRAKTGLRVEQTFTDVKH